MGSRGQSSQSSKFSLIRKKISQQLETGKRGHEIFSESDNSAEKVAKYLGVSEKEALGFINATWDFTAHYFSYIRAVQTNDKKMLKKLSPQSVKEMKESAEKLEKYISLAPKWNGGSTHRGINLKTKDVSKYKVGDIIDVNRGTASWSSEKTIAKQFAKGTNQSDPKGKIPVVFSSKTQSRGTSIKHLSNFAGENEVLVSKNSKYEITSINTNTKSGIVYVNVKEVK